MGYKHTPGPWEIKGQDIYGNDKNGYICSWSGSKADAQLIAAAPDLLEAVQIWLKFWDEMPKGQLGNIVCDIGLLNDGFIKSGQAIEKAIGEPTP